MSEKPPAFYVRSERGFESTDLTRGPWDPDSQHAGPPCALLARAIEAHAPPPASPSDPRVGRVSFEILRPVPICELRVEIDVVRPGRSVELIAASLRGPEHELIRAHAWRIGSAAVELPPGLGGVDRDGPARSAGRPSGAIGRPPGPEHGAEREFFPGSEAVGYHTAMEYRFVSGGFNESGPAVAWMRMRVPLIAGERPSPLVRVLVAADSGNGVSAELDPASHLFINVDLTVNLHRLPVGEWVCLDARTIAERTGIGLADTMLFDSEGALGRATQTLLIRER